MLLTHPRKPNRGLWAMTFACLVGASGAGAQELAGPLGTPVEPDYGFFGRVVQPLERVVPGLVTGNGILDAETPDLVMTLRGGVRFTPAYMGASAGTIGPDAGFRIDYAGFPGGFTFGSNDSVGFRTGWGLRGSMRYLTRRDSSDYPEIAGLNNIPFTIQTGLGLGYEQRNYRVFADARYGVVGSNSWVGEVGADGIAYPLEGLTLTAGPRLNFGSDNFMRTYFGISPSESVASGLPAHDAGEGLYGAGIEVGARYLFNERWGVEGLANWSYLQNGAADSPIAQQGAESQYRVRLDLTRRISLDF